MTVPFSTTSRVHIMLGCVSTGKTERLIEQASTYVSDGAARDDVLVLCAAPQALDVMKRRLQAAGIDEHVRVSTVRDFALGVLSTPAARSYTGRKARVMLPFEHEFLFEDLKTSGLKPKRLREMLKFFYRNFSELNDDDDSWLLEGEETSVHDLLKSCLSFSQVLLPDEVSNFAVKYLRHDAGALAGVQAAHVLVDDFQALSRASQVLVCLMARETLDVASDPYATEEVYEAYPYWKGADELVGVYPGSEVEYLDTCRRPRMTARAVSALLADDGWRFPEDMKVGGDGSTCTDAPGRGVEMQLDRPTHLVREDATAAPGVYEELVCESPDAELSAVVARVSEALDAGVAPADVCVAYASETWGRELAGALEAAGVPFVTCEDGACLNGDVHDAHKSAVSRMAALLMLLADSADVGAVRSLLGFDTPLAASYELKALRERAQAVGGNLPDVLADAHGDADEGVGKLAGRYERICHVAARCGDLRGHELLDALAQVETGGMLEQAPAQLERLVGPVTGDETAAVFVERLTCLLGSRGWDAARDDAVRLLGVRDMLGLDPKLLVFSGMVNGLTPPRLYFDNMVTVEDDKRAMWADDLRRVYAALGKCSGTLVIGRFTRAEVTRADSLDLRLDRIRIDHGQRVGLMGDNPFLDIVRPACEKGGKI